MEKDSSTNSIRSNMQSKKTDELLEIWNKRDQEEFPPTALEIVKEILLERLGEIPKQEPENTHTNLDDDGDDEPLYNEDRLIKISS